MSKHTYTSTSIQHTCEYAHTLKHHIHTHTHTHTEHVTKSSVRSLAAQETTAAVLLIAEKYNTHGSIKLSKWHTGNSAHSYIQTYKQLEKWLKRSLEERRSDQEKEHNSL